MTAASGTLLLGVRCVSRRSPFLLAAVLRVPERYGCRSEGLFSGTKPSLCAGCVGCEGFTYESQKAQSTASVLRPDGIRNAKLGSPRLNCRKRSSRRSVASSGNPSWEEPQGLLAHGKDHCQWCWNDEQVAAGAGTGEPEKSLGVTRSTSLNRLVRTRMPRWCGEGGQK
jgi:hypothetical protein